ncbi:Chromosomal replication initiator protein DnaA [Rhodobacteraceae bacterium THAF1]|nr:chromosomal replication initiator protein DnaA [Palleronia sp. THAF1]QFU07062.1 Chromosomal replication initiator protein DnaA [Palleronia sp. THAF1]VDC16785.1 Chromosomal replication initiator protein DnaA [Rhodobacteraceae bacterium THAF1]
MTNDGWGKVKTALKSKVGGNNYSMWIEPLEFRDLSGGVMTFAVRSPFVGTWVDRYFRDPILREAEAAGFDVHRLSFVTQDAANTGAAPSAHTPEAPGAPEALPAAPTANARPRSGEALPFDQEKSFDTFVVGKPNELAYAAARRVASGGPVSFNPLFLYGGSGLGKTHLMNAIAWELQERDPSLKILFISAEMFMHRFVQALREKDMMGFKALFRAVDVLMVDDVKFIAGKNSTQEEFFHTFNALVGMNKQIILSSDTSPGEIDGLENRLVSRFNSGLVIDIHPTSYELRLGILQRKMDIYARKFPGAVIGEGVMKFVAHRVTSNVRELEGAMTRLFAHSSFLEREVDTNMAQEFLHDLLKGSERKASIDAIQRSVADHYAIRLADLVGPKRNRVYARPRQVAMFLAKEMTDRSLPEIARKFGKRDHTTIMYGIRKIEELMVQDQSLTEDVTLLRRALSGQ